MPNLKLEDILLRVIIMGGHDWERAATRYMLTKSGFHAREACDGAEAVSQHLELPCDALVLHAGPTLEDVLRPARAIREQSPSVKVISLVDRVTEPHTIRSLLERIGEHPIVFKPFVVESFWRLILALPYERKLEGHREVPSGSVRSILGEKDAPGPRNQSNR